MVSEERLDRDDGIALLESNDLLTIGALADLANRRRNGDRVYFVANQHINPTNVCILNKVCVFCSYGVRPTADNAYTMPLDEVWAEAEMAKTAPTIKPATQLVTVARKPMPKMTWTVSAPKKKPKKKPQIGSRIRNSR